MSSAAVALDRKWLQLAIICLCFLPVSIDATILYVALPELSRSLHADANELLWIVDIYPFVTAGCVLLTGPLGDRYGHQRVLFWGLVLFAVTSLWAALSATPAELILARAFKGVAGAMIVPSTLALIRILFDDARTRAIGIGLWGALASVGAAAGPPLGGLLLVHFSWGSVFLANLPVLALLLPGVVLLLPNRILGYSGKIDVLAPVLGLTGLLGVIYALKATAHDGTPGLVGALIALYGFVALYVFTRRELASDHPLLDLRLFAIPLFRQCVAIAVGCSMVLMGFELLLAQYLQLVMGLSPLAAGLAILPFPLAGIVFGPVGGLANVRFGPARAAMLGLSLAGFAYIVLTFDGLDAVSPLFLLVLGLIGTGHALAMAAATSGIMAAAPEHRAGEAAGLESVSFEVGSGLGMAIFGSIVAAVYVASFVMPSGLVGDAGTGIGAALGEMRALAGADAARLESAAHAAYLSGFRVIVYLSAAIMLVLAGFALVWSRNQPMKSARRSSRLS